MSLNSRKRQLERRPALIRILNGRRIRQPPVNHPGCTRPNWTFLRRGTSAKRDYNIQLDGTVCGKLIPTLGSKICGHISRALENLQRDGVRLAGRLASAADSPIGSAAPRIQYSFRDEAASRVARAQEQDVEDSVGHRARLIPSVRQHRERDRTGCRGGGVTIGASAC